MSSKSEIFLSDTYPTIYQVELEKSNFNDVLITFVEEILPGSRHSTLESALVEYVTSVIEPVGWKAVWRSTKKSSSFGAEYDFVVEVINVSLEKLEAEVLVKAVISADSHINFESLKKLKNDVSTTVPLIELYTVSEGDEEEWYLKTAVAIQHVRLFMQYLQRPWDSEEDVEYTEDVIKPRLQLYFDMANNGLPKAMISKIKMILKQASKIQNELYSLFAEMNVSDSEAEINEEDFVRSISLKEKLSELQTKMEMLENPVIRSFVKKKYSPGKMAKKRYGSGGKNPVTFIVAKAFSMEIINCLPVDSNTILEFEHSPETAFKCSSSGDKIIIFPGHYQCDTLGWMEESVSVKGVGCCTDIILEATGNSDILFNCLNRNIVLENITLKAKIGLTSAVLVHHGKVHLKNCIIDCNGSDIGLELLGGAEAALENCTVCNAKEVGILLKSLSSLDLISCKVEYCQRYGIMIDAENEYSLENSTDLFISDSYICNNGSYGMFLNNAPITEISLRKTSGDFTILKRFSWLKHKIENTVLENNGEIGIGVFSACGSMKPQKPDFFVQNLPAPEELNYSALSELLNAVNMSMELETQHLYK